MERGGQCCCKMYKKSGGGKNQDGAGEMDTLNERVGVGHDRNI